MINPVSTSSSYLPQASQSAPAKPASPSQTTAPQDTVQLSSAAKAALGDVDHDGDSH